MIQATFYKHQNGTLCGFSLSGHAGFAESGKDIVCAGVSALAINTVNAVERFTDVKFSCEQGESGLLTFQFQEAPGEKAQVLLDSFELGMSSLKQAYGDEYLELHYEEM